MDSPPPSDDTRDPEREPSPRDSPINYGAVLHMLQQGAKGGEAAARSESRGSAHPMHAAGYADPHDPPGGGHMHVVSGGGAGQASSLTDPLGWRGESGGLGSFQRLDGTAGHTASFGFLRGYLQPDQQQQQPSSCSSGSPAAGAGVGSGAPGGPLGQHEQQLQRAELCSMPARPAAAAAAPQARIIQLGGLTQKQQQQAEPASDLAGPSQPAAAAAEPGRPVTGAGEVGDAAASSGASPPDEAPGTRVGAGGTPGFGVQAGGWGEKEREGYYGDEGTHARRSGGSARGGGGLMQWLHQQQPAAGAAEVWQLSEQVQRLQEEVAGVAATRDTQARELRELRDEVLQLRGEAAGLRAELSSASGHTSSILTQLQAQMQMLLGSGLGLAPAAAAGGARGVGAVADQAPTPYGAFWGGSGDAPSSRGMQQAGLAPVRPSQGASAWLPQGPDHSMGMNVGAGLSSRPGIFQDLLPRPGAQAMPHTTHALAGASSHMMPAGASGTGAAWARLQGAGAGVVPVRNFEDDVALPSYAAMRRCVGRVWGGSVCVWRGSVCVWMVQGSGECSV